MLAIYLSSLIYFPSYFITLHPLLWRSMWYTPRSHFCSIRFWLWPICFSVPWI